MTQIDSQTITTGLVENAARDFDHAVSKHTERIKTAYPNVIFQERHVTGWLWWKRVYYTYWRYSEGRMLQLEMDSVGLVKSVERASREVKWQNQV